MATNSTPNVSYDTVDDAIAKLRSLRTEHGNLPIRVRLPGSHRKPTISGFRFAHPHDIKGRSCQKSIDIIPKYDVMGAANQLAGINSVIYELASIKTLFVNYAQTMMGIKSLLEGFAKRKLTGTYKGKAVEIVPTVKEEFIKLYDVAREIRDYLKSLADFDSDMKKVIGEPLLGSDYVATFAHHIDMEMTDSEFAKLVTTGIGEKTSVQRLAVYNDILRKINKEIANRRHRINALEKRVQSDSGSNEANNATLLIRKSESIIATLMKRKEYILNRYDGLKSSIFENIKGMDDEIAKLFDEHAEFSATTKKKGGARRAHS